MTNAHSISSEQHRLAVVGLGRVGLPTACAFAQAGWDVFGVDRDPDLLEAIRSGDVGFREPLLDTEPFTRLTLHRDVTAVTADVWIVCVGTTVCDVLDAAGVIDVVEAIASRGASMIVIESTVPPGTCVSLAASVPDGVHVAHCPERAAPGSVFADLAATPRLIGGVDPVATGAAYSLYASLTDAPLVRCTATQAELSKLAENASREVAVAFANELASIARGLDVDPADVIALANTHPRVDILRPGLGVGGDCLPMATGYFAAEGGALAAAAREAHRALPRRWADELLALEPRPGRIAVLGTTYKPDVRYRHDPYEERPVGPLLAALSSAGVDVRPWDPSLSGTARDAVVGVDLVVFGCAHRVFGELDPETLGGRVQQRRYADPVGAVDRARWEEAGWAVVG